MPVGVVTRLLDDHLDYDITTRPLYPATLEPLDSRYRRQRTVHRADRDLRPLRLECSTRNREGRCGWSAGNVMRLKSL